MFLFFPAPSSSIILPLLYNFPYRIKKEKQVGKSEVDEINGENRKTIALGSTSGSSSDCTALTSSGISEVSYDEDIVLEAHSDSSDKHDLDGSRGRDRFREPAVDVMTVNDRVDKVVTREMTSDGRSMGVIELLRKPAVWAIILAQVHY